MEKVVMLVFAVAAAAIGGAHATGQLTFLCPYVGFICK